MIGLFEIGGRQVRVDFGRGICIAIPLNFNGPQPSHFGAEPAKTEPMRAGGFIGDVRQGGSCNVPILTLNPHCNGTHTESIGHIVIERVAITEAVPPGPVPATLVSIQPVPALESGEAYRPALEEDDRLITAAALQTAMQGADGAWLEALVVRTLPNGADKRTRRHGEGDSPPFFSLEAIDLLGALGVRHLLVDLPSVDRTHDEGLLTAHHRFWRVPEGTHALAAESRPDRTITEMTFVPNEALDGPCLLTLEVPAFVEHVAPSRPWLFLVEFV